MSEHDMDISKIKTEVCVGGYESAWLGRWTRFGSEVKLQSYSNRNAKCSKGSMKLKGKLLTGFLDHFPYKLDFRSNESEDETKETDQAFIKSESPIKTIHLAGSSSSKGLRILQGKERVDIIPDMNKEPLIVADEENLKDGEEGETSSSATQSMNVEYFLNNNLFKECKRIRSDAETETDSRSQIKRQKTNTSDYTGNETKSMMALGASGTIGSNFFHRIFKHGTNKPRSKSNQEPFKNLSMGGGGGEEGITLQHPWIQRWCNKKAIASNEGQQVNPKGFAQEKQFPSVAAMAMMRKALIGSTPIGNRKTNSLFVWNAREI